MEVQCRDCNRRWFLERHKQITRDIDEAYCRCGKELHRWSEAASYTPIQIFPEPTITQSELASHDPQTTIPLGTTITVTTMYESRGPRLQVEVYRLIRIGSQRHLVEERDLMAALGDPFSN
jgi:hypothetical protein